MKKFFAIALPGIIMSLALLTSPIRAQFIAQGQASKLITNIPAREKQSLDGVWRTVIDQSEAGLLNTALGLRSDPYYKDARYDDPTKLREYDFGTGKTILVPGDWNTQRPEWYYYEGVMWYRRLFYATIDASRRQFIYFGAVNYKCNVYLNGEPVGSHEGGFTPFDVEVTGKLKDGENTLILLVDNRRARSNVPTLVTDWWNYGGITRPTFLVSTPKTFIRDYFVQLAKGDATKISGWVQLDGSDLQQEVTIRIPELKIEKKVTTDASGKAAFDIPVKNITLWEPENPKLYDVQLSTSGDKSGDTVKDQIGFRTIETRGNEVLLNGKKVFFRGVAIHEEAPFSGGRAYAPEQYAILLGWAKELGCNFVRLAHYPHGEDMIRTAERMGIMVWSEIPVYWAIDWTNPATYANAVNQLDENITRDRNRCNIAVWSVANETPVSDARMKFLTGLINEVRARDNTRLVSAAMLKTTKKGTNTVEIDDPLAKYVDLVSFNQYTGWYGTGGLAAIDNTIWDLPKDKPIFISEWGGGARYGFHDPARKAMFSEEYQEDLYTHQIASISKIEGLAGTTPWILMDFHSPRRQLTGIQDELNRKGLVSDKGQRKLAFFVLQKWYSDLKAKEAKAAAPKVK